MKSGKIAVLILLVVIIVSGCATSNGTSGYKGRAKVVLMLIEDPREGSKNSDVSIPENPASIDVRARAIYSEGPDVRESCLYNLTVDYYASPEPPGFIAEFRDRIKNGTVIGINHYMPVDSNISVFIGNTPEWRNSVFIIENKGPSSISTVRLFKVRFDLASQAFRKPISPAQSINPLNNIIVSPATSIRDDESGDDIPGTGGAGTGYRGPGSNSTGGYIEYMGFRYAPSSEVPSGTDGMYSTGQTYNGNMIYVSTRITSEHEKVPGMIFLRDAGGSYSSYSLAEDSPAYAYSLYRAYNTNESVSFGLVNDHAGQIELRNSAPWEIQRLDHRWMTVFRPIAAQVITPLANGTFKEWTWDQRMDNGRLAPFGDYRVVIDDIYIAAFTISPYTPAVEVHDIDYSREMAQKEFMRPLQCEAFSSVYPADRYNTSLRDDLISQMQFKAWRKGMDPSGLRSAIDATGIYATDTTALPGLAVHAEYEGRPAWFIVFNQRLSTESLTKLFIVDDTTGSVIQQYTCPYDSK